MFMLLAGPATTLVMALCASPLIIALAGTAAIQWTLWLGWGIEMSGAWTAAAFMCMLAQGFLVLLFLKRRGILTSLMISVRRVVR